MSFSAAQHLEPWRKWGSSETIEIPDLGAPASGLPFGRVFANLINVEYFRPDTWTLFLGVQLMFGPGSTFLGDNPTPVFNVSLGVGQLNFTIPRAWGATLTVSEGVFADAYTTTLRGIVRANTGVIPVSDWEAEPSRDLHELPAQTLQVQGQFDYAGTGSAVINFIAMAAPRSHIRPEWFVEDANPWGRPI
jgi:hypothetical protein